MNFQQIVELLEEKNCIPMFRIENIVKGGVLFIPPNVIDSIEEREIIYEVYENKILIYENKEKIEEITVQHNIAIYPIMLIHMAIEVLVSGTNYKVIRFYNDGERVNGFDKSTYTSMMTMINPSASKLEKKLIKYVEKSENVDELTVPEDISDAYDEIMNFYKGKTNV
jgi:hypothetical protein